MIVSSTSSPGRRRQLAERLTLCFHGVGTPQRPLEPGEDTCWLEPPRFAEILDEIVDEPGVRITFDDGNESDASIALPMLLQRRLSATFFVLAGRMGTTGSLSDEDVRTLADNGMKIGTHGYDHRQWRRLDDTSIRRELVDARSAIETCSGERVTEAACPFGAYDRGSLSSLRRLGYERVYTVDGGYSSPRSWLQTRCSVHDDDDGGTIRQLLAGRGRPSLDRPIRRTKRFVKRWR